MGDAQQAMGDLQVRGEGKSVGFGLKEDLLWGIVMVGGAAASVIVRQTKARGSLFMLWDLWAGGEQQVL